MHRMVRRVRQRKPSTDRNDQNAKAANCVSLHSKAWCAFAQPRHYFFPVSVLAVWEYPGVRQALLSPAAAVCHPPLFYLLAFTFICTCSQHTPKPNTRCPHCHRCSIPYSFSKPAWLKAPRGECCPFFLFFGLCARKARHVNEWNPQNLGMVYSMSLQIGPVLRHSSRFCIFQIS